MDKGTHEVEWQAWHVSESYNHHLRGVFKRAGTSGAGITVSLQCEVMYSKHQATEIFTLFKGTSDSDYMIVGHNINSTALLEE